MTAPRLAGAGPGEAAVVVWVDARADVRAGAAGKLGWPGPDARAEGVLLAVEQADAPRARTAAATAHRTAGALMGRAGSDIHACSAMDPVKRNKVTNVPTEQARLGET